jgi:allophanate hydrolase subunit 1
MAQRIQSILDVWPGFEMKLIELDVDSYFHNPWIAPRKRLSKAEKELLKEKHDRQIEVSFYDAETMADLKFFEYLELLDRTEARRRKNKN